MTNWIPDINRFRLPKPPEWFLKALWDQDAGLVLLPSRMQRKYLLARRRSMSLTMATIAVHADPLRKRLRKDTPSVTFSDGDLLAEHSLVLVDAITARVGDIAQGSWMRSAPAILSELRKRDLWANGGQQQYSDRLEANELAAEVAKRTKLESDIDHRARDAWRSYQARTGQRTRVGHGTSGPRVTVVHAGTL